MPKKTLTQLFVNQSVPSSDKKIDYFDTRIQGLVLRIMPSGTKTYSLRYRDLRGRQTERKLCRANVLKLSEVRQQALSILAKLALGEDPFEARRARQKVLTLGAFVKQAYLPYAKSYKRSWSTDESLLRRHILPAIGTLYLDEVTRQDVIELLSVHRQAHQPASTNRVLILCRYIFNCALKWESAGVVRNPTHGVALYPENNQRERFLSPPETRRLFSALESSPNLQLPSIVAALLLTGARRREVLDARWKDMDTARRLWRIEFNKTGRTRYVPLSEGMLALLDTLPRGGEEYLFPNPKTGYPYVSVFRAWDTVRRRAGLADVRLHDLRHSFASYVINSGRSLYEVQRLLGHTQVSTTQRYAHLSHESLLCAVESASDSVPWQR
tara:strand:+ start:2650 stop:3801 length:1152 start_codon:yes stop_codon:yes gene_type:complete